MIKKTLTYVDFDGNTRTEDFFFNLSEKELVTLDMSTPGGFEKMVKRIVDAKSQKELIELFEKLIRMSYGVKTPDGKRFIKNQQVLDDFMSTQAYSDLYMELVTDTDKAIEFFNGMLPSNRRKVETAPAVSGQITAN